MPSLTAAQLCDAIQQATQDDNRAVIEAQPGLTWMLPELDAHVAALSSLLGGKPPDTTLRVTRTTARGADLEHDDAHRFLFGLLGAGLSFGPPERRAAIEHTLGVLYPEKLRSTQVSYHQEVANAAVFALRLERPDVQAGLDAASVYAPQVRDHAQACIEAAERLDEVLRALEAAEVEAAVRPPERALFDARNAALATWSIFVSTVEHVLAGDAPDVVYKRIRLLQRWRGFTEQGERGSSASPDTSAAGADRHALDPQDEPEPV